MSGSAQSRKLGYITTGPVAAMVYQALVDLPCGSCGTTIAKGTRFTRSGLPGGGARRFPICRACAPFTARDEDGQEP